MGTHVPTARPGAEPAAHVPAARPRAELAAGWTAMLPFWLAALPAALAYVLAAQQAGLSAGETLLFSLLTFSAPAQLSAVSMLAVGTTAPLIAVVVAVQSIHLVALGLELARHIPFGRAGRLLAACLLTDAAWAVSSTRGKVTPAFYLGAGLSMYSAWALGTALALAFGARLPLPDAFEAHSIAPLAFAALLAPLLRSRGDLTAALAAAGLALVLGHHLPSVIALPVVTLAGAILGWLSDRGTRPA